MVDVDSTAAPDDDQTTSVWVRIAAFVGVLVALAVVARFLPVQSYVRSFLEWVDRLGFAGAVALGAVYVVATVGLFPGSILTLGAGYIYGVVWGTILISVASTTGAALAFVLGRYVARDWVRRFIDRYPMIRALDSALEREAFEVVFLLRLVPLVPFNALNYALGLTKIPLGRYVLASWIGMIPGTIMYNYFGSLAKKMTQLAAGVSTDRVPVWDVATTVQQLLAGDTNGGVLQNVFYWLGFVAAVGVAVVLTRAAKAELERLTEQGDGDGESTLPRESDVEPGEQPELEPRDNEHNRRLERDVFPPDRVNPEPEGPYNLVAVGGGTAGLVGAAGAAGLGAKSALIERHLLGGDCLNSGCVPSKALISAANRAHDVREADDFGVRVDGEVRVDFGAVMERMRRLRADIGEEDSVERFESLGVDVYQGNATFVNEQAVEVGDRRLQFDRALIATGGRPAVPPIPGLEEVDYLTNETVFSLTERPDRLLVVGGGPIGSELAQAFQRFDTDVAVVEQLPSLLGPEDDEATELVEESLRADGVDLHLEARVESVGREDGGLVAQLDGEEPSELRADEILLATGRAPNVAGLGLEAAGVAYDPSEGVEVNDRLQTTNPAIFAAGDVASPHKFTHTADAQARLVLGNALFYGRSKASELTIPWCTYTDPEVAHVGLYPDQARERGYSVTTYHQPFEGVHRYVLEGRPEGFLKVHAAEGSGEILGATVVGQHAGELINELTLAATHDLGLGAIADTIHPYPTRGAAARRAADQFNRDRLKGWMESVLERWFAFRA